MKNTIRISSAPYIIGLYICNGLRNSGINMNKVVSIMGPKKLPSPPTTMYMRQ